MVFSGRLLQRPFSSFIPKTQCPLSSDLLSQVDSEFGMIRVKKADLLAVAHYLIRYLSYSQVPALAKRHKVEAKKDSASAQELLVKKVGAYPLPSRSRGDLRRNPLGTSVWSRFRIDGLKVLFCPSPANGTMIPPS
jgi:hypothetical protein